MNENESKKVPKVILALLTGKAVPLSEVPDPVFSDKVLGDGVAIIPADVRSSNVICNGKNAPVVSDHYGVIMDHFIIRHLQKYKAKRKSK